MKRAQKFRKSGANPRKETQNGANAESATSHFFKMFFFPYVRYIFNLFTKDFGSRCLWKSCHRVVLLFGVATSWTHKHPKSAKLLKKPKRASLQGLRPPMLTECCGVYDA